ncbi:response regulator transcription factor [Calderihabitans maritimus]|uniref:Stage 0 sporulation protein A homolog n=1 Tax=Calderihabitans maritimus TaxID=1246530 RepID=A0A1Z5HW49_9FIRM|nr:response regulator transcription factor [Calderihabitans maritimus]GAW93561.1 two component transcriptional regulator [Calderihabitans maritimus]
MGETVLVVDDEENIVELVSFNLESAGYQVLKAYDGREALEKALECKPDLIVLDVMLPELDGFEVCRRLRARLNIPILMLTARKEEIDRVLGLEIGADDYLTKPFSPRELVARVKAILRRSNWTNKETRQLKVGYLELEPEKHRVTVKGIPVNLTLKEFELLELLARNPGRVFSREELLEKVWGYDYPGETRTIDVHIRHLRQKIEENPSQPRYILTVRGVGYKFEEPLEC